MTGFAFSVNSMTTFKIILFCGSFLLFSKPVTSNVLRSSQTLNLPLDADTHSERNLHVSNVSCECDKEGNGICRNGFYEWSKCYCNAGYTVSKNERGNLICRECNCGQRYDGRPFNCTSRYCDCGEDYKEENGKCKTSNVCRLNPCLNNGICADTNEDDSFECMCQNKFYGRRCENTAWRPCNTNLCRNGGTCQNVNNHTFQCHCPPTHTGVTCAIAIFVNTTEEVSTLDWTDINHTTEGLNISQSTVVDATTEELNISQSTVVDVTTEEFNKSIWIVGDNTT